MRIILAASLVAMAVFVLAGCCAPAYSTCAVGGPAPCGTATYLDLDGSSHFYKIYPRGTYIEQPITRPN